MSDNIVALQTTRIRKCISTAGGGGAKVRGAENERSEQHAAAELGAPRSLVVWNLGTSHESLLRIYLQSFSCFPDLARTKTSALEKHSMTYH
jgi:hypothetical protein